MEEEKQKLMEAIYKLIEPKLKKRNLYCYMIDKLKKNQDRLIDHYENELLKKDIKIMEISIENKFYLTSYNKLVALPIDKYPIWLRCLMWWERSRLKRWWEQLKKRYKESRKRK